MKAKLRFQSVGRVPRYVDPKGWAEEMRELNLCYHIDDDPGDIVELSTGKRTFTDAEAAALRELIAEVYERDNGTIFGVFIEHVKGRLAE